MDTNISFFSLPFVDSETSDLVYNSKNRTQEFVYDDIIQSSLPSHSGLLTTDDVLAQFLDDPLEEPDLNGPTTLHCEICRKQFDNAKKYYGHLRVHSKDNLWICDKCPDQKFSTKQQLMKHSLNHKPLQRVWRCQQCCMAFEALWRLQQHLFDKHLVYRPHKCDQCDKSFQKLSDLKKHKDMHTDIKRHACPTCPMKFKDKSNLKRHMLRHTDEKPYSCVGCGNRFKQLASMKRHARQCAMVKQQNINLDSTTRKNYCRLCGMMFIYKSALLEHCVREHTNSNSETNKTTEDKTIQSNADANGAVDNIVDDILLAEEDYMTMSTQNEMLNVYNSNQNEVDNNTDNLMQIELLKDMNQLQTLDDELLYNDLDFDSFQTNHIFNTNEGATTSEDRNEVLFDFTEGNKSIDQDIMNALYQVRAEHLPDELLNVPELNTLVDKPNDFNNSTVSVNECATIFESDVDLEASTNLAANLNQLIGENSVQYISTEDDDTFIISLDSGIDAEQLTDMLNIGVELVSNNDKASEKVDVHGPVTSEPVSITEPIVLKIQEPALNPSVFDNTVSEKEKKSVKKRVLFVCRTCNKVFTKKDNYKSHMGTHEPALRRHVCGACGAAFGYRSSLNKHRAACHEPRAPPAHRCARCPRRFRAAWMLRQHVERDHERQRRHACAARGCGARFYKRSDLAAHARRHAGQRPHACAACGRRFAHAPHLARHARALHPPAPAPAPAPASAPAPAAALARRRRRHVTSRSEK